MKKERRVAPRADIKIPVRIRKQRRVIEGRTKNISSTGAYCVLDTFIPLNTELDVSLLIPEKDREGRRGLKKLKCHGIVVRNQPEPEAERHRRYGMAIFFTSIAQAAQKELSSYVRAKLPPEEQKRLARMKGRKSKYQPGEVFSTGPVGGGAFRINSANFRVLSEGINLSKNGICCQTDRSIPLFREIAVNLILPASEKTEGSFEALQCSAVVVGCNAIPRTGRYNLAAYFVGLSREQKERLDESIRGIA